MRKFIKKNRDAGFAAPLILKADQSFAKLIDELAATENRIAVERKRYNDKVMEYNQMRRRFPSKIIASMFNFTEAAYFKVPETAKEAPKVDFGKE